MVVQYPIRQDRKVLLAIIVVLIVATVLALSSLFMRGSSNSGSPIVTPSAGSQVDLPTSPESNAQGREVYHFESLDQMLATAEILVVGTVKDVSAGRVAGPEGQQIQMRDVRLLDVTLLKGAVPKDGIVFEELGWVDEMPTSLNGSRYANPGDRVIVGLMAEPFEGRVVLVLASTQSRFFVDDSGRLHSNYLDGSEDGFDQMPAAVTSRFTGASLVDFISRQELVG